MLQHLYLTNVGPAPSMRMELVVPFGSYCLPIVRVRLDHAPSAQRHGCLADPQSRAPSGFNTGFLPVLLTLSLFFPTPTKAEENVRLACEPRTIQVVPGEPVRVELTIEADSAAPLRMHIPADPLLVLRAVEKLPIRRTKEGVIVHKRVVLWQALEPGTVTMHAISVETQGRKVLFPAITITVRDPGT
jgi:hypothetical protein